MSLTPAELALLPYRAAFGTPRPAGMVRLPPAPMPSHAGLNPLKAWRYVGCFGAELMICVADVRVGPARQGFFAVYDRRTGALHERTGGRIELSFGRARVIDEVVQIDLHLGESERGGIETVTAACGAYAWTRKQAPVPVHGRVMLSGEPHAVTGSAIIDDSAGYLPRHTHWRWCAGTGTGVNGEQLAWNIVEGIHDSVSNSERTVWIDGYPVELPPTPITADLSGVGTLRFRAEATRTRSENRLIVRSRYRQPFGTFSGEIGGVALAEGYGVMEEHDAHW